MGPISSIGAGAPRPATFATTGQTGASSGAGALSNRGTLGPSQGLSTALAMSRVQTAVSEMLRNVGGGVESNKALQMLIALVILLALMESSQNAAASSGSGLEQLGAGRGSGAEFISLYSSSTTITFEQSTTTLTVGSVDGLNALSGGEGMQSQGSQVDIKA